MKPEGWTVVTNGKKFRLRHVSSGRWYTETRYEPIFGNCYTATKEWDNEEEAREVAERNTWRPV